MSLDKWTNKQIHWFIEEIKKHKFFWDPKEKSYKNKSKKLLFLQATCKKLNEIHKSNYKPGDLNRKWHNLKHYFHQKSNASKVKPKSGAEANDEEDVEKWPYFDRLLFLKETEVLTVSVNNYQNTNVDDTIDIVYDSFGNVEEGFLGFDTPEEEPSTSQVYRNVTIENPTTQDTHQISFEPEYVEIIDDICNIDGQDDVPVRQVNIVDITEGTVNEGETEQSNEQVETSRPKRKSPFTLARTPHPRKKKRVNVEDNRELLSKAIQSSNRLIDGLMNDDIPTSNTHVPDVTSVANYHTTFGSYVSSELMRMPERDAGELRLKILDMVKEKLREINHR